LALKHVSLGEAPSTRIHHNLVKERRMPRKIDSDECISCGSCAEVCPEDAIAEGEESYVIDPEKCIDCGVCEDECPVDAISAE
jgi:NAD-dependent dihydropyrimidine dehydrogenase PreA subunit